MPAPKNKKTHKSAKGLDDGDDLDAILKDFSSKRCEQLLETVTLADTVKPKAKKELGTKNERRARRKEMQEGRAAPKEDDYPALPPQDSNILTPDQPKPSFAWDPLDLSGPHHAIGAGAHVRNFGEVPLD
mmetsp:Transcript_51102/g.83955  ORF Transcript_51102/g.83955 Transcript_51102/m.83955 type:complete len:130 (+) Transcript_51102:37-426(+)